MDATAFDPSAARRHMPVMDAPIRIMCSWCGSEQVSRDAWADWDVARQEWVLGAVFDDGHCHRCARAVRLVEAPVVDVPVSVAT